MTKRTTRCNHKEIGQRVLPPDVNLLDIDGFEILQGVEHEFLELIEREFVLVLSVGQMKLPMLRSLNSNMHKARVAGCIRSPGAASGNAASAPLRLCP